MKGEQTEAGGLEGAPQLCYFFPGVEERTPVVTIPR